MNKVLKYTLWTSLVLTIVCISIYGSIAYYVGGEAEKDTGRPADAALVLGAKSYIGDEYNPCLVARVTHAVDLYKAGEVKKLVVTGGYDKEDGVSEAATMRKIAIERGVPGIDILEETKSTSTYENFLFSKTIIEKADLKSIIIVTEPFHTARASLIAEKQGFIATQSPATSSTCWTKNKYLSRYFLKEPLAIIVYKLQNKL